MAGKDNLCKANVGTRKEPRPCGQPIAKGMLAACGDHTTALIPTSTQGVYARGGKYVAVSYRRGGKQHKTFHDTFELAKEAKHDRSGSARPAPQKKEPFDAYARQWIKDYQGRTSRGFDEDTRASYERALELYAIPHFGSTPLREIDRKAINAVVAKLRRQGLAPTTIAKYLAPVRALFSDAVGNGHLTANPALRLAINAKATVREDDDPSRVKDMSRGELAAVLAAIPDRTSGRDPLFFALLAGTGCRISEALGLDWADLGHDGATLRIERQWYRGKLKRYTKTANGHRTISLSPDVGRRLWERGADATGPMFATRTGKRLSARNMARFLEAAAKAANVPHVSPHSFRHTHGSLLLDEGWPITEVAHRLGDDVQTVSRTYAHKLRDSERDLGFLDSLGNAWATQDPETTANPDPDESGRMSR